MRIHVVLFLAAAFALLPFQGLAADKPIKDVKELAGSWQGWVTAEVGDERANMIVEPDGRYKASTTRGTQAEGQFYLQDGKLMYAGPTNGAKTKYIYLHQHRYGEMSPSNGTITLRSYGEGDNWRQAPVLEGVWGAQVQKVWGWWGAPGHTEGFCSSAK